MYNEDTEPNTVIAYLEDAINWKNKSIKENQDEINRLSEALSRALTTMKREEKTVQDLEDAKDHLMQRYGLS